MEPLLTIGEFAVRCGLSRSALRFYDRSGLLTPRFVDEQTGYRRYAVTQLADAVLVRRLRAAELPVGEVRRFLTAPAPARSGILEAHAAAVRARAQAVDAAVGALRGGWCEIAPATFAAALGQLRFAIAAPEARPELCAVWIESREDSLRLVATDSYRLAVRDLVPDALSDVPIRGAIDGACVSELAARCATMSSLSIVQDDAGALRAGTPGALGVAVGGPGDGFPDYERVLSGVPAGSEIVVGRAALGDAIAARDDERTSVALRFRADGLAVQDTIVPGVWRGSDIDVWLHRGFIGEALAATVGPDVAVEAVGPRSPVTLRSADTGTFSVLTMPIAPPG